MSSWKHWAGKLKYLLLVAVLLVFACPAGAAIQEQYTIRPYSAWMGHSSTSWATARGASSASFVNNYSYHYAGVRHSGNTYGIDRGYVLFDTSWIPDNAVITAATLKLYVRDTLDDTQTRARIYAVQSAAIYDPPQASNWKLLAMSAGYAGYSAFIDTMGMGWNDIPISAAHVVKDGMSRYMIVHGYDYANTAPLTNRSGHVKYDSDSGVHPPVLVVEWVAPPSVVSYAATDITQISATANGRIADLGYSSPASWRGAVWDTVSHADPGNVHWDASGYTGWYIQGPGSYGVGDFSVPMGVGTPLIPGTPYYYRTVAYTDWGFEYSSQVSFTTLKAPTVTTGEATNITNTTARLSGTVTGSPAPVVTLFWGTTDGGQVPDSWDFSGTAGGAFVLNVYDLEPGLTYYFNARAANTAGTVWAGTKDFITSDQYPTVTTGVAEGIIDIGATLMGEITSVGAGDNCTAYGFVWKTESFPNPGDAAPSLEGGWQTETSTPAGPIDHTVTGLAPGTPYYYRAAARNSVGWAYGDEQSFTTSQVPQVSAVTLISATTTSLQLQFSVVDGDITEWGYRYGVGSYTENVSISGAPTSPQQFELAGLVAATQYQVEAWAENIYGVGLSGEFHCATLPPPPLTLGEEGLTYTEASLTWTGDSPGWQLRYSTVSYPTTSSGVEGYSGPNLGATVGHLPSGGTVYFSLWGFANGVYSTDALYEMVTLPVPPPIEFLATPLDGSHIRLWWAVPHGLPSGVIATIRYTSPGENPDDGAQIYDGSAWDMEYVWDSAQPGTPYQFTVWFDGADNLTALCTTPAGYDQVGVPGGGFEPPDDSNMGDIPGASGVNAIADIWGIQHGMFWCILAIVVAMLCSVAAIIATKSGLLGTAVGGIVLVAANTQGVCPVWATMVFVFLGLVLSWVQSRSYS